MTPKKISCPNGIGTGHAALYRERIWRLQRTLFVVYDLESGECQLQSQYDQEKYSSDQANAIAFDEKAENVFLAFGKELEYAELLHQKAKRVC